MYMIIFNFEYCHIRESRTLVSVTSQKQNIACPGLVFLHPHLLIHIHQQNGYRYNITLKYKMYSSKAFILRNSDGLFTRESGVRTYLSANSGILVGN